MKMNGLREASGLAGRLAAIGKRCAAALARRTEADSEQKEAEKEREGATQASADGREDENGAKAEHIGGEAEENRRGADGAESGEEIFGNGDEADACDGGEADAVETEDGGFEDGEAQGEPKTQTALATETARENERRLSEIRRAFPNCTAKSVEELGDAFGKLMSAGADFGLSAADAYAATHISQIRAEAERAAEERARARVGSKSHLVRSEGSQSALCEVPKGIYEKYKRLMPKVSDREIREHYNRSVREETV